MAYQNLTNPLMKQYISLVFTRHPVVDVTTSLENHASVTSTSIARFAKTIHIRIYRQSRLLLQRNLRFEMYTTVLPHSVIVRGSTCGPEPRFQCGKC